MAEYVLSESELCIMKIIWRDEKILTMQEVAEKVNQTYARNWKHQTVSVFLGRIVKKKLLTSKRAGRKFYYPVMTEEDYCKKEATKWVNLLGDGKADGFLECVAKARGLSEEEKSNIRKIIDSPEYS